MHNLLVLIVLLFSGTGAEVSRARPIFIALSEGPQMKVGEQAQQLQRKIADLGEAGGVQSPLISAHRNPAL